MPRDVHGEFTCDICGRGDVFAQEPVAFFDGGGDFLFAGEGVKCGWQVFEEGENVIFRARLVCFVAFEDFFCLVRHFEGYGFVVLAHCVIQAAFPDVRPFHLQHVSGTHSGEVKGRQPEITGCGVQGVGEFYGFQFFHVLFSQSYFLAFRQLDADFVFAEGEAFFIENAFLDRMAEYRLDCDEIVCDGAVTDLALCFQVDFELRQQGNVDMLERNVRAGQDSGAGRVFA